MLKREAGLVLISTEPPADWVMRMFHDVARMPVPTDYQQAFFDGEIAPRVVGTGVQPGHTARCLCEDCTDLRMLNVRVSFDTRPLAACLCEPMNLTSSPHVDPSCPFFCGDHA